MSIRIIRKALCLLLVDIVIIIGIFVLQFRTDSSIIQKIGNLQFSFSQSENKDNELFLLNKVRISYNGINFYFDDQTPAIVRDKNSEIIPVSFTGYEKKDDLSYILNFTKDVKVTFELASLEPDASLAIIADIPSNLQDFAIPYNFSASMRIQKEEANRVILNTKKSSWEASAFSLDSGYFDMNRRDYVATYSLYDETQTFTFDTIVGLEIADLLVYEKNIQNFKDNLVSSYKTNNSESNISEQVIVSYLAAQLENGNYTQALDEIPANLKKSRQRTYLSAPYLNTLEEMHKILESTISDYENKINESANNGNLDIFTVHNISNFMCIHSKPASVIKLLQFAAASDISSSSLAQATGILSVYNDLATLNPVYAAYLEPALKACVDRITQACSFENNVLTISENDTFLSVIQAVETGVAIMRYGYICQDVTLQKAGYVLVNSYMSDSSSYDLRTLANLYPIIAYDNKYYPHFEKLDIKGNNIWAWTCAKSISCEKDTDNSITLTIDFPEKCTHYLIIKGIPQFSSIYIYNMAFRTDPRFETYNSSGYVYKNGSHTLLLKSRHKSQIETVRLEYRDKISASSTVTPKTSASESTKTKTESSESKPVTTTTTTTTTTSTTTSTTSKTANTQAKTEAATSPAPAANSPAKPAEEEKTQAQSPASAPAQTETEAAPAPVEENKTEEELEEEPENEEAEVQQTKTSRWRRGRNN